MQKRMGNMDWSLIESFLDVAETGSLSAAARRSGMSQPTLGRRIARLEAALGSRVFQRQAKGVALTETGRALLPDARAMRDSLHRLAQSAAGADQELHGTVRLTASHMISQLLLPDLIAQMRRAAPQIAIELVPSDSSENLLFGAADIAIRMYDSRQLDIISRRLGMLPLGLFAARSYLERRGTPQDPADLAAHDLVGYDRDDRIVQGFRQAGVPITREDFVLRCDAQATYWELVCAGCGIGVGQVWAGARDPRVLPVLEGLPLPALPVTLAATSAMRSTPRIARVWDLLCDGISPILSKTSK